MSANTSSGRFIGLPKCRCHYPISAASTPHSWITVGASRRRKEMFAARSISPMTTPTANTSFGEQIDERLDAGVDIVSATYVTPYPPGFPVLVPGQLFSREILQFMRDLDTPEIHGYAPNFGYRVYTEKAIEMVAASVGLPANGHRSGLRTPAEAPQKTSKRKPARRSGNGRDRNLPEVGQEELLGEQQPGDALTVSATVDHGVAKVGEKRRADAVQADTGA